MPSPDELREDIEDLIDFAIDFLEAGSNIDTVVGILCDAKARFHKYLKLQEDIYDRVSRGILIGEPDERTV